MSASTITALSYLPEGDSKATPELWNRVFREIDNNVRSLNSVVASNQGLSTSSNVTLGGFIAAPIGVGIGTYPPSQETMAGLHIGVNSNQSQYIYFTDSSGQRSSYALGSHFGLADGLALYDVSGDTMLANFSKQSIRFFQNVVGPVFDTGGALASTLNTATFGTGADSNESRIQSAIDAAAQGSIARVYIPANMYPYSGSSVSFINSVQMVREGGEWSYCDFIAYGARGNGVADDTSAVSSAISAAFVKGLRAYASVGTYLIGSSFTLAGTVGFAPGGRFSINSGATIRVAGLIEASAVRIFTGGGGVRFQAQSTPNILLNWFAEGKSGQGSGGSMTNGSAILTTTGGDSFEQADVGKKIIVQGVGAAGVNLRTTIATFTSSAQVTLATSASTTGSGKRVLWSATDHSEIQKAINAVQENSLTLIAPVGAFMVGSTVTMSNTGMEFLFTEGPASAIRALTDVGEYVLDLETCQHARIRPRITNYQGNGVKIRIPNAVGGESSVYNTVLDGTNLTGLGVAAIKPSLSSTTGAGAVGLLFGHIPQADWGVDANYFCRVEHPFIAGYDTAIHFGYGANGQVIVDPHLETYWYGIAMYSDENTVRGGFWHNSAGQGSALTMSTEAIHLGNTIYNRITGGMPEPGNNSYSVVIDTGASLNEIDIRDNTANGILDNSAGLNTNTDLNGARLYSFSGLADNTYYRIGTFTIPNDYTISWARLRFTATNAAGASTFAGSGEWEVRRGSGSASITLTCAKSAQFGSGTGVPQFVGFEKDGDSVYPIFFVSSIAGTPEANLDTHWEVTGSAVETVQRSSSALGGAPVLVGAPSVVATNIARNHEWDAGGVVLGSYYLWVDATGDLRIKSGAPTTDLDGVVVGGQS